MIRDIVEDKTDLSIRFEYDLEEALKCPCIELFRWAIDQPGRYFCADGTEIFAAPPAWMMIDGEADPALGPAPSNCPLLLEAYFVLEYYLCSPLLGFFLMRGYVRFNQRS